MKLLNPRLMDFGVNLGTRISFADGVSGPGELSLGLDDVDLTSISHDWDFTQGYISSGTLTGMPNGGAISNPTDSLRLRYVTVNTPLHVSAGQLTLEETTVAHAIVMKC